MIEMTYRYVKYLEQKIINSRKASLYHSNEMINNGMKMHFEVI